MKYFQAYADHFDLRPFIQFGVKVMAVRPVGKSGPGLNAGLSHDGGWEIVYTNKRDVVDFSQAQKMIVDKVIIATGHHWKPFTPIFDGMDEFQGEVMHSHNYRDAHPFKDKKCLVVGIGNSAVDLAVELSFHAKQVYLSSRKSAWVIPRYSLTGAPADQAMTR